MKKAVRHFPESEFVKYVNSGSAISAGVPVDLGALYGIPQEDIAATTGTGTLHVKGEFELAANTGIAFAVGEPVYWDAANARCDKAGTSGSKYIGMCTLAKASADTTVRINLNRSQSGDRDVAVVTSGQASANSGKGRVDMTVPSWVTVSNVTVSVRRVTSGNNQSSFAVTVPSAGTLRIDGISSGDLAAGDLIFVRIIG
jgi:predicted RecA/RadA family phage recombinase